MSRPESDPVNPYAPPKGELAATLDGALPSISGSTGYVRYLVVAALCAAAVIAYVQRNSLSVAEVAIREELDLTKQQMGWVISAFFLTYALLQLPTGWLAKTLGTRRALPIFAGLFSAAAAAFSLAWGLPFLWVSRLSMGAFQSGIFPCAVTTISKWTPLTQRSLASGLLGGFMSVGGALGGFLTGLLLPWVGWRLTFALFGVPGFLFAVWFYFWFRDSPAEHRAVSPAELETIETNGMAGEKSPAALSEPTPWGTIFTSVPILALCAQQVFRAAGYMFFASWFTTFLRETRGVEDLEAGLLTSLPLWAVVFGGPLGGYVSDRILARTGSLRWSRQGVSVACLIACTVLIVASYPIESAWLAVLVISAGSFCAAFAGPVAYTAAIDLGGKHVAMVFSLMNMAGNIGAFLFPIVVPWLLAEGDVPGSGNWTLVLFLFAGTYLVAAFFWLLADPRKAIA